MLHNPDEKLTWPSVENDKNHRTHTKMARTRVSDNEMSQNSDKKWHDIE